MKSLNWRYLNSSKKIIFEDSKKEIQIILDSDKENLSNIQQNIGDFRRYFEKKSL